jgi:hypothetical protein
MQIFYETFFAYSVFPGGNVAHLALRSILRAFRFLLSADYATSVAGEIAVK